MKTAVEKKERVKTRIPGKKNAKKLQAVEEAIRQRAFEIYLARGGAPGYELEDWLRAERESKENNVSEA